MAATSPFDQNPSDPCFFTTYNWVAAYVFLEASCWDIISLPTAVIESRNHRSLQDIDASSRIQSPHGPSWRHGFPICCYDVQALGRKLRGFNITLIRVSIVRSLGQSSRVPFAYKLFNMTVFSFENTRNFVAHFSSTRRE